MKDAAKPRPPIPKQEYMARFAMSAMELAVYIILPIIPGYLIGRNFGVAGTLIGLTAGAIAGLLLAVNRALKMHL